MSKRPAYEGKKQVIKSLSPCRVLEVGTELRYNSTATERERKQLISCFKRKGQGGRC